jgi:gluconokinase
VVASGGALTASNVWSQMLADVLNRPIHLSTVAEASTRGAVLLALEAQGKLKSITHTHAPFAQTFEPDASRHERYLVGLERHEKLYKHLVADREIATAISRATPSTEDESNPRCQPSI